MAVGVPLGMHVGMGGGVWAAAAALGDPGAHQQELEARRKQILRERDEVRRALRNEDRKRQRLIEKAKGLSNQDLMDILAARAAAKAKAKPKAKAKAKAAPSNGKGRGKGKGADGSS